MGLVEEAFEEARIRDLVRSIRAEREREEGVLPGSRHLYTYDEVDAIMAAVDIAEAKLKQARSDALEEAAVIAVEYAGAARDHRHGTDRTICITADAIADRIRSAKISS